MAMPKAVAICLIYRTVVGLSLNIIFHECENRISEKKTSLSNPRISIIREFLLSSYKLQSCDMLDRLSIGTDNRTVL